MNEKHAGLLGATSLAGECLLTQLAQNHWHITAFSRRQVTRDDPQVTWRQLAPIHPATIDTAGNNISFWLCAAPIWVLPEYFDLLLAYGARRVIVVSSTSRFTKNTSSVPEERKIAQQLIESEELVQTWAATHGIEWIILRPTLIYGYGRDKNITEIARFISRFGFFPLLGPAQGLRQPIHAGDLASACYFALSTLDLKNRSYNLPGGETLPYREMVQRVFAALDKTPRLLTMPLWLFRMAVWWVSRLPRYRHWTTAMAERMNQDLCFDCSDARRDLNFSPRAFKLAAEDLPSQN